MDTLIDLVRILPRWMLALLSVTAALVARGASDVRFSSSLTGEQRARAGLMQLSADNVAVIDGLVRQDEAASQYRDNDVDRTHFSQRRTPREREIAGLDRLTSSQVAQLDQLVAQRIARTEPVAAGNFVATTTGSSSARTAVKPNLPAQKLDIHGEVSFTQGWTKGGSMTEGDILLTYEDPEGRFGVAVGYSEIHGKGMAPCFSPGYGLYRPYGFGLPSFR